MKASFDAEQPAARSVRDGHTLYIFICVNGQWTERQYDESAACAAGVGVRLPGNRG